MLLRYDPFRDFDRWSRELFSAAQGGPTQGWMPMDAIRRGDHVVVVLDLPGVDPSSIDLTAEKNVLTVKAERNYQPGEGEQVFLRERPQGAFTRQVFLSENLDLDKIEAHYENGVLAVTIPVSESAKPRKIQISGATQTDQQAITVDSTSA